MEIRTTFVVGYYTLTDTMCIWLFCFDVVKYNIIYYMNWLQDLPTYSKWKINVWV